jgi:hypothetical protein
VSARPVSRWNRLRGSEARRVATLDWAECRSLRSARVPISITNEKRGLRCRITRLNSYRYAAISPVAMASRIVRSAGSRTWKSARPRARDVPISERVDQGVPHLQRRRRTPPRLGALKGTELTCSYPADFSATITSRIREDEKEPGRRGSSDPAHTMLPARNSGYAREKEDSAAEVSEDLREMPNVLNGR